MKTAIDSFPFIKLTELSNLTNNKVYAVQGAQFPSKSIKYLSVLGIIMHLRNTGILDNCTDLYGSVVVMLHWQP